MKKLFITGIVSVSLLAGALSVAIADTSSMNSSVTGMGILENEWIRAGVNGNTGTFGSGGGTSPGLLFDPTAAGSFDPGYDYLTPGSPFDGFSVKVDGTNYANNNTGSTAIANDGNGLTDGENSLSWTGGVDSVFNITNTYSLAPSTPFVDISSSITMLTDADTLSFGKYIDPDSQGMPGDSSATDNVLGYGVIPSTNVAFSEATVSRYALGIYTTDTNVTAGVEGWTQEADGYSGTNYTDADGNPVNYGNGDDTIGISWTWTGVGTGDILTASYAYIFGPSAFDAADEAVAGGAGGGDTTTTDSWGTVEDVGSATDAAESGGSTPEPVITYSDPVVDTDRPVLTASITHHTASETATVQTIDREKTTTVTTPMEIITYTDGVETARTDTTSDIETTVTDPGSFTGRVDQIATAQDAVSSTLRNLDFDNIQGIRMDHKMKNGMTGSTTGAVVGGSKELENGLTVSGGFIRLGADLSGNDDTVKAETDMIGFGVEKNNVSLEIRHAMTDYTVSRTIGDFANSGETKGKDTSARIMYSPDTGKVNPVIGYTRGKKSADGYTEAGSIQSARTIADSSEMYGYGTVGLRGDLGLVDFTALHHTDGTNDISLGIEKQTEKVTWRVGATRSMTDLGNTNSVTAGIVVKF